MPGLRQRIYQFYFKLERWLAPGLNTSQQTYFQQVLAALSSSHKARRPVWLDVGCGHQVFAYWMLEEQDQAIRQCEMVCGIDLDSQGLRKHTGIHNKIVGNLTTLPFRSAVFNVATANMVAEHLDEPVRVLREVHRVLAPGGTFLFHTPNAGSWFVWLARGVPEFLKKPLIWFFEDRRPEDVFETRYLLNRSSEIERAAAEAGFVRADITYVSTNAATAMLGPFVIPELLWIRALRRPALARYRSNLVVQLRKG